MSLKYEPASEPLHFSVKFAAQCVDGTYQAESGVGKTVRRLDVGGVVSLLLLYYSKF